MSNFIDFQCIRNVGKKRANDEPCSVRCPRSASDGHVRSHFDRVENLPWLVEFLDWDEIKDVISAFGLVDSTRTFVSVHDKWTALNNGLIQRLSSDEHESTLALVARITEIETMTTL